MDQSKPRKDLTEDARTTAAERAAVSRRIFPGAAKAPAKLQRTEPPGRAKPPVSAARRQAADAEREVGRGDLPLPPRAPGERKPEGHSLGMRVQVDGDRITLLDSLAIDTPPLPPDEVRGTDFLAVLAGPEVIAVQRLIDPGLAFGIADPTDPETEGHREMTLDTYELTILVPLERIDRMSEGEAVEIVQLRARETTVLDPRKLRTVRDRGDLQAVASSGEVTVEELRGTLWTGTRGRGSKPPSDADSAD